MLSGLLSVFGDMVSEKAKCRKQKVCGPSTERKTLLIVNRATWHCPAAVTGLRDGGSPPETSNT